MRSLPSIGAIAFLTSVAAAQSVYIDFGFNTPPSPSYAAAAGEPGHWNEVVMPTSLAPLVGLQGQATAMFLSSFNCDTNSDFENQFPYTIGDDGALLDDWFYGDCAFAQERVEIHGVAPGAYVMYVYAKANGGGVHFISVTFSTSGNGALPQQTQFPGTYTGWQVEYFQLNVPQPNSTVTIRYESSSSQGLSGAQLVRVGDVPWTGSMYCFGDGSTQVECPCNNQGISGQGCANLIYPRGAQLSATGTSSVSADTVVLQASGMSGAQSWFFQSTEQTAQPWGYGLLCMSGSLLRVGQKALVNGSSTNPSATDLPLSVKGAIPPSGGTRHYQVSYRQANPPCTPPPTSNTNRTNGLTIVWTP